MIRTINARHRKHYKAGSVWKPGEQQAAQERVNKWAENLARVSRFLRSFNRSATA